MGVKTVVSSFQTSYRRNAMRLALGIVLALLILAGCAAAQSSTTDDSSSEDLAKILRDNPDLLAKVREQVKQELRARGYDLTDAQVDELLKRGFVPGHLPPDLAKTTTPTNSAPVTTPKTETPTVATPSVPPKSTATPPNVVASKPVPNAWPPPDRAKFYASDSPRGFARNVLDDQETIWTAPRHVRVSDLNWMLPFAGLTAGLVNADAEISSRMPKLTTPQGTAPSNTSTTLSNMGLYGSIAGAGGMYLMGKWRNNPHEKETGALATEAVVNAVGLDELLKFSTRRQRPYEGNGQGDFFQGTYANSSFASMHSAITWSIASVVAHEYPGKFTKFAAYGLAGMVSATRVTGRDHFPSDVLIGSALGYFIGEEVYARHHDPSLPGGEWGLHRLKWSNTNLPLSRMASPYVPLDSWVYPAFDRLAALGVVQSATIGMKPWTRSECARLLDEAKNHVSPEMNDEASTIYARLVEEFHTELEEPPAPYAAIDSLYWRATQISGTPMTDGYHFTKTIINDSGRPYGQGFNSDAGFTSSGSLGMLGFYISGEVQHAPGTPAVSQGVQNVINSTDFQFSSIGQPFPVPPMGIASADRFRLLDTYVTLNLRGWQASFGKQSMSLSPTTEPFMWSNNAEPIYMFRLAKNSPGKIPLLGAYKTEFFIGKLDGQHTIDNEAGTIFFSAQPLEKQPMVHGEKVTFKPTANLEFGIGRTGLWGGQGMPVTAGTTRRSYIGFSNAAATLDEGDQRSFVDFSYRVPGLRNWLTIYNDEFVEDEFSPIGYPRRAAQNAGFYMPKLPGLNHMDLRFEGGYTNVPDLVKESPMGGFFYWNVRYRNGYTNNGDILGSAIGRWGQVYRAQSTYWFAPDRSIQFSYRNVDQGSDFLLGGHLTDASIGTDWRLRKQFSLGAFVQYERWNFPLLSPGGPQNDIAASIQLTYHPHWRVTSKPDGGVK